MLLLSVVPCCEVFTLARDAGWKCTSEVVEAATTPFRQVIGTEVVEDGFKVLRTEEVLHSGYKKKMSAKRKWSSLVCAATESSVHHYESCQWEGEVVPRGDRDLPCRLGASSLALGS